MRGFFFIVLTVHFFILPAVAQQPVTASIVFDTSSVKGSPEYFRVARSTKGQWWFLTPEGKPFFYKGICAVNRAGTAGGRNAVPGKYAATVDRKYHYQQSPDSFVSASLQKLHSLGFNALGAWSTEEFYNKGTPFTEILEFFKEPPFLPAADDRSLPDIFDPLWETAIDKKARALCTPLRTSKDLVGYFTDNEIGFGNADDNGFDPGFKGGQFNTALLRTLLAMDSSKAAFKYAWQFLFKRYSSYEKLSVAWQVTITSAEDIRTLNNAAKPIKTAGYEKDATDFVQEYAGHYFELSYKTIRRHDPNHLILGCRFGTLPPAYISNAIIPWTDVISVNNYRPTLYERYDTLYQLTQLPLLIGEISWNTGLFKRIPFAEEQEIPLTDSGRMFRTGKKTLIRAAMHNGIAGFTWYRWVQGTSSAQKFYDGIVDYNDNFDMHAAVLKQVVGNLDSLRATAAGNAWKFSAFTKGELILFPENLKPGWDQYIRMQVDKGRLLNRFFGWQLNGELLQTTNNGSELTMNIRVNFESLPSEKGIYKIKLRRSAEKFYGSFSGTCNGKKVHGNIKAFYFPD